ncbi:PP2C family protein-serine/threonine phosphatase [Shewanella waksmanii]|uniref:PP2C family protein-serine/threonine phosphatase n=1 Tax=Shewanella waksmanii TaxID=213783 RepID=UPI001B7F8012|nr:protein phosphatase 2C domain-containing protein [Shewanella waksmanii]
MHQTSHGISHRGTVREINEDACLELTHLGVWVVADGMGGHAAGDVASQLVIDVMQQALSHCSREQVNQAILVSALEESNRRLRQMSQQQFAGKVAGSTVVVLWIHQHQYHLLWAGDSRGYLYRGNQLTQVTKDHSQVNDMVDEGVLLPEEAEQHPLANVITRAVGVDDYLCVDIKQGTLVNNDIFLLCSDGLNKELSDQEIANAIQPGNIIDSGMALIHSSLVRNARDNVTCILVKSHYGLSSDKDIGRDNSDATIPVFI